MHALGIWQLISSRALKRAAPQPLADYGLESNLLPAVRHWSRIDFAAELQLRNSS
jgi:hypothetical protein